MFRFLKQYSLIWFTAVVFFFISNASWAQGLPVTSGYSIDIMIKNKSTIILTPISRMDGVLESSYNRIRWDKTDVTPDVKVIALSLEKWKLTFVGNRQDDGFYLDILGVSDYEKHKSMRVDCSVDDHIISFDLIAYGTDQYLGILRVDNKCVGYICE